MNEQKTKRTKENEEWFALLKSVPCKLVFVFYAVLLDALEERLYREI